MTKVQTLPKGWAETTLGDILPISYGKGLAEDERNPNGQVPIYGSSGILGRHDQALTSKATLIIGRKGSVGSVHYSPVPCWSIDTTYFVEESTDVNLLFFSYLLSHLNLNRHDKSTVVPGLSRDDYNALTVKIPPLAEQQRIVEAIERYFSLLDAVVAELRQKRQQLKRYRAAVLKAAVDGSLTAQWRSQQSSNESASILLERILAERRARWEDSLRAKGRDPERELFPAPAAPDPTTNLPALPQGWCLATVEQLAAAEPNSLTDGPFGSNLKTAHYRSEGIRVIRLQNIGDGEFKDEKAFIDKAHFERLSKYRIFSGDLVIAALGDNPPRSCIIPDFVGPAIVKADCIRFKVSPHIMNTYVNIVLNAEPTRKRTKAFLHGIGRPRLNLSEIKHILIVLPPLTEQEQTVAEVEKHLSIIRNLEGVVHVNLKYTRQLRQVVLREAFAGRLIPQDPEDEPANVLLERIQEERRKQHEEIREVREVRSRYPVLPDDKLEPTESGMTQGLLWETFTSEQ